MFNILKALLEATFAMLDSFTEPATLAPESSSGAEALPLPDKFSGRKSQKLKRESDRERKNPVAKVRFCEVYHYLTDKDSLASLTEQSHSSVPDQTAAIPRMLPSFKLTVKGHGITHQRCSHPLELDICDDEESITYQEGE